MNDGSKDNTLEVLEQKKEQWFANKAWGKGKSFCTSLEAKNYTHTLKFYTKNNYQVLSFQEWLDENGYVFEDESKFIENTWYESDCGEYYGKFLNKNKSYSYPDEFPSKEYINVHSSKFYNDGVYFFSSQFSKAKLAPMEEVDKYLPAGHPDRIHISNIQPITHSYKDYKEGDYVVITEYKGEVTWFKPGEVLKLGGKWWKGSIKDSFDACSNKKPFGNGVYRLFEDNYKIRKATQEEIDSSQWGNKMTEPKIMDRIIIEEIRTKPTKYSEREQDIKIEDFSELKVKLRKKRIKISL